jgi:hypothetical protein
MEKGYAAWTGPREDSLAWIARARGWMRVMTLDALVSMLVYTVATCGFYVLGATVLRAQPSVKDGNELILQLSSMFTEILGTGAQAIFMLCAFTVLYSTVFANTAGFSRLWTDFFGLCGWLDWNDPNQRRRSISFMAWVFPILCGVVYYTVQQPLLLVIFMGIANSLFLVVVAYQAVIFRYRYTQPELKPPLVYDLALWLSILSIAFMAGQIIYSYFNR